MPDVDRILSQVESLMEHETFSSPPVRKRTDDPYRVSVCAIVRQVKHLLRDEQYPLVLARRDLVRIAG